MENMSTDVRVERVHQGSDSVYLLVSVFLT